MNGVGESCLWDWHLLRSLVTKAGYLSEFPQTKEHCLSLTLIWHAEGNCLNCCFDCVAGKNLLEHFQLSHNGPLVQFFSTHVKIQLAKIIEERDLCYVVNSEGNTFFVKILLNHSSNVENSERYHQLIMCGSLFITCHF